MRRILSWPPLVEIGKRSYGLYLWSWPIFVILGATDGSVSRFVMAMIVTVAVTEASYRCLETPVRKGAIGDWWSDRAPDAATYGPLAGGALVLGCLVVFYASVQPFDPFKGGGGSTFELADAADADGGTPVVDAAAPAAAAAAVPTVAPGTTLVPGTTIAPATSANLAIVGDSQAHALAINLPDGIESTFPNIANGAILGCGVYDEGFPLTAADFGTDYARTARGGATNGPRLPTVPT